MDKKVFKMFETISALDAAVTKWHDIAFCDEIDHGSDDCHLCNMFYDSYSRECTVCPIKLYAGKDDCVNTPYTAWKKCFSLSDYKYKIKDEESKQAAIKMYEFVRMIRNKYLQGEL